MLACFVKTFPHHIWSLLIYNIEFYFLLEFLLANLFFTRCSFSTHSLMLLILFLHSYSSAWVFSRSYSLSYLECVYRSYIMPIIYIYFFLSIIFHTWFFFFLFYCCIRSALSLILLSLSSSRALFTSFSCLNSLSWCIFVIRSLSIFSSWRSKPSCSLASLASARLWSSSALILAASAFRSSSLSMMAELCYGDVLTLAGCCLVSFNFLFATFICADPPDVC